MELWITRLAKYAKKRFKMMDYLVQNVRNVKSRMRKKIDLFKNLRGDCAYFSARSCKNACNTCLLFSVNWLGLL
jgi:hypothetical protein